MLVIPQQWDYIGLFPLCLFYNEHIEQEKHWL